MVRLYAQTACFVFKVAQPKFPNTSVARARASDGYCLGHVRSGARNGYGYGHMRNEARGISTVQLSSLVVYIILIYTL